MIQSACCFYQRKQPEYKTDLQIIHTPSSNHPWKLFFVRNNMYGIEYCSLLANDWIALSLSLFIICSALKGKFVIRSGVKERIGSISFQWLTLLFVSLVFQRAGLVNCWATMQRCRPVANASIGVTRHRLRKIHHPVLLRKIWSFVRRKKWRRAVRSRSTSN